MAALCLGGWAGGEVVCSSEYGRRRPLYSISTSARAFGCGDSIYLATYIRLAVAKGLVRYGVACLRTFRLLRRRGAARRWHADL